MFYTHLELPVRSYHNFSICENKSIIPYIKQCSKVCTESISETYNIPTPPYGKC